VDKTCTKCETIKPLNDFYKRKGTKDGLRFECIVCTKRRNSKYYEINQDEIIQSSNTYYHENKDTIIPKSVAYKNKKYKTDPRAKLMSNLRSRFGMAVKYNSKSGSAIRNLGCSIDELKIYLESLFQPGMTWDNHTHKGWHIDHIRPLATFDLTDIEQLKQACHYTNLQPLWARENWSKGKKV
jgi:hypothetical protein